MRRRRSRRTDVLDLPSRSPRLSRRRPPERLEKERSIQRRDECLKEQIRQGKLAPSDRPDWEEMWALSEDKVRKYFESKKPGSVVHVGEIGRDTHNDEEGDGEKDRPTERTGPVLSELLELLARKNQTGKRPTKRPTLTTWDNVDRAFWNQSFAKILVVLTWPITEVVPEEKVQAFRRFTEALGATRNAGLPVTAIRSPESPRWHELFARLRDAGSEDAETDNLLADAIREEGLEGLALEPVTEYIKSLQQRARSATTATDRRQARTRLKRLITAAVGPRLSHVKDRVDAEEARRRYEAAKARYDATKTEWGRTLRRSGRASTTKVRRAGQEALARDLAATFPDMHEKELNKLVAGAIDRKSFDVRDALLSYVGSPLMRGPSTIRDAVASSRKAEKRRKRMEARRARFLQWVARVRPELLVNMTTLLTILEGAKASASPVPDFYAVAGPLYLDFIRGMRMAHSLAAAVR